MKKKLVSAISVGLISLSMASSADAALLGRLAATPGGTDYLAYYDDVAKLTWLTDVSYAYTIGDSAYEIMNWDQANAWVGGLTVEGVSGWRLPETVQPDPTCRDQVGGTNPYSYGYGCTGSELGNLYYNVLGNGQTSFGNKGPFINIYNVDIWTSLEDENDPFGRAWSFSVGGYQQTDIKNRYNLVWAVQSGDVSAVPVPAAVWLFGSGLLGLVGVARRKKT